MESDAMMHTEGTLTDLQTKILRDSDGPCCVGIDIGTTTICAYVLDCADGTALAVYSIPNAADLPALFDGDHRQDADVIFARVQRMTDAILARFAGVSAISFTGQMHGVLCIDVNGRALSPLYTWQDERAGDFYVKNLSNERIDDKYESV